MNFQELTTHANAGPIEQPNLLSLEGGIYPL